MLPQFDYGDEVRVIRNVRNDGTFPGVETGALLIRRGSIGYVRDVGTFLQDQIIYSIHFLEQNLLVGCREEELINSTDTWIPSIFEFRDKVVARIPLSKEGNIVVQPLTQVGQIMKVLRHEENGVAYHVLFRDRLFQIPETALLSAPPELLNDEATTEEEEII